MARIAFAERTPTSEKGAGYADPFPKLRGLSSRGPEPVYVACPSCRATELTIAAKLSGGVALLLNERATVYVVRTPGSARLMFGVAAAVLWVACGASDPRSATSVATAGAAPGGASAIGGNPPSSAGAPSLAGDPGHAGSNGMAMAGAPTAGTSSAGASALGGSSVGG